MVVFASGACSAAHTLSWPADWTNTGAAEANLANCPGINSLSTRLKLLQNGSLVDASNSPSSPNYLDRTRPIIPILHGFRSGADAAWVLPLAQCVQQRYGSNAQIVVVDASDLLTPPANVQLPDDCIRLIPNPSPATAAACYLSSTQFFLDAIDWYARARGNVDEAARSVANQLRCGLPAGQQLNIPLIIGHSLGGLSSARMLPYLLSNSTRNTTLLMVDPPTNFNENFGITNGDNELVYSSLAKRTVHFYNDRRAIGGFGSCIPTERVANIVNLRSAGGLAAGLEHNRLADRLVDWLCTDQATYVLRNQPVAPNESQFYEEIGTTFTFGPSGTTCPDSLLPPGPSLDDFVAHSVWNAAYTGPFWPITDQLQQETNVTQPQVPGEVRVAAVSETTAGFSLGDIAITDDQGWVTFEYQLTNVFPNGPGTGQYASVWLNDRPVWMGQTPTPAGQWGRGMFSLRDARGGTSRIAIAMSRRVAPTGGQFVVRDVRIVPRASINLPFLCDPIDFNNDTLESPEDLEGFFSVYSGGPCIPAGSPCNDIDFNNDGIEFDPTDLEAFFSAYSGGPCLQPRASAVCEPHMVRVGAMEPNHVSLCEDFSLIPREAVCFLLQSGECPWIRLVVA